MLPTPDQLCAATAAVQFGIFNRLQALAAGHTDESLWHRLRAGRLEHELPEVYAFAGSPKSWYRSVMGACLWAKAVAAASHRTAARLWGIPGFQNARVEISVVNGRRPHGLPFRIHRVDRFVVPEIVSVANIPTTSIRRTLLDLAGIKDRQAEWALDYALNQSLTSLGQMWLFVEQEWVRGRRGIAILRSFLIERTIDPAPTHSELENMMKRLMKLGNLPRPVRQHEVILSWGPAHIDFAYPAIKLAIEVDGYAAHGNRKAFERDKERDLELEAMGWTVLRFTWAMVRFRPEWVIEQIKLQLARLSG